MMITRKTDRARLAKRTTLSHTENLAVGLALAATLAAAPAVFAQDESRPPRGEEAFAALDANADGSISFVEYSVRGTEKLARLDSDENGVLTLDEFLNAKPQRPPGGHREVRGKRAESTESPEAREATKAERRAKMQARIQERFVAIDANGDEVVTTDEFLEADFLELDMDNNGALTKEELRPRRRSEHGAGRGQG